MQSLSIFGIAESICFEFQNLERIEIHLKISRPGEARFSAPPYRPHTTHFQTAATTVTVAHGLRCRPT
jgi:hypothetical protein